MNQCATWKLEVTTTCCNIDDAPIFRFYGQFHKGVLPKLVVVWFPNNEDYRAFRNNFDMVLHNAGT